MTQLSEDLRAAKALIDTPKKWFKKNYGSRDGRLCAMGAVHSTVIARLPKASREDCLRLYQSLRAELPMDTPIYRFNDHPATTHLDIMALFDRAIAKAEAECPPASKSNA